MIHRMSQWSQCHDKINNELKVVYFQTFSGNENLLEKLVFYNQMMYKASSQVAAQEYSFEMNAYNSSNDFEIVLRIATFRQDAETLDEIMHKEVLL